MALSIGEANAVNTLARFVSGVEDEYGDFSVATSRADAIDAFRVLLKGAHKALGAGFTPEAAESLVPLAIERTS